MKCQHCGLNDATVYVKSNVNGHVTEQHLCQECAAKLGLTRQMRPHFRPMSLFSEDSFFSDPFEMLDPFFGRLGTRMLSEFPEPVSSQPSNTSINVPEPDHSSLLPENEQQELIQLRKQNAIRAKLQTALEKEDYETAAKLRDELKSLES